MNEILNENLELKNTKDKIICVSIDEFANKGYDKASMRKIADKVGIKASSIYNHFKSKDEILEEIFKYYRNVFYQYDVILKIDEVSIQKDTIPNILKRGLYSVVNTIKNPEITNILKIIIKEQFKNKKIRKFFLEEFIENPRIFIEKFLKDLMKNKFIKEDNACLLAQEFHAFAIYKIYEEFMLKDMSHINIDELQQQISEHIDFFWKSIRD
ncbi:TetR/AcrR family transcriptional regulator [Clostridium pasteurianum]|uniref:Transcriptional regulator n=1 Tax=Clostridium pasteurianum BC1 TaxID=86416 RepID=R4KFQ2_CLOPA|nr:TetR/AcrR family transcriptional regulator [Clostridium pasteurianum]AGK99384.1 transcriptional regulator [Clostridium pasteurianum BC1]